MSTFDEVKRRELLKPTWEPRCFRSGCSGPVWYWLSPMDTGASLQVGCMGLCEACLYDALCKAIEAGMAHVSRVRFKTPMEALAHTLKASLENAIENRLPRNALGQEYPGQEIEPTAAQKYWHNYVVQETARSFRRSYPAQYVGDPVVPQLLQIQHETQTDRECARRLAEQLSAGGTDGGFERESIRRRVEAELWWLERVKRDLQEVHGIPTWEPIACLGVGFRKTSSDWRSEEEREGKFYK